MPPILLFALLLAPQEKPPELCAVSGTVVDSITEKPVANVQVELRPVEGRPKHTAFTRSAADGRFTLVDLDPGSYHLVGERAGYLESSYRARRAETAGAVLRLEAGQTLDSLTLKMIPGAVISGRVVDHEGEPVAGSHVVLSTRSVRKGRLQIQDYISVDTDDQGAFRFAGVAAGKYYILAEGPPPGWLKVDHSPRAAGPREALVPTLYPGVPDLNAAAPLEIRSGERREGIDIRMLRSRVFRLAGRVVNAPPDGVVLALRPIAIDLVHDNNARTTTRNAAGDFEFRDVAPGAFWLQSGASMQRVDMGFADLEGVRVALSQPSELRISVAAEGPEKPPTLEVGMLLTGDGRSGAMSFETGADGRASRRAAAGFYDVEIFRAAKGYYVKSVRSGERDVLLDRLEVPPSGVVPLDLVLAGDGAKVEGSVGESVGGATVVLLPAARARLDLYRTETTDQYGSFRIADVPPGAYKIFAWEDVNDGDWFDPDFLKRYESQGVEFQLDPRSTKALELKIARDK